MPIRWFLSLPEAVLIAEGASSKILYHQDVNAPRNFVVDLANYTPASAEKGYLSAAR